MSFKVLLKKDWKQVSLLWMLLVFLGIVAYTLPVWTQMQSFDEQVREIQANPEEFAEWYGDNVTNPSVEELFSPEYSYFIGDLQTLIPYGGVIFLYIIFGFLMASVLIGSERNSQMSDFAMSLPFNRNQLYISKWLIGTSGIIVSSLLGGPLMLWIIHSSRYSFLMEGHGLKVAGLVGFMLLTGIAVFSLALWMGSFGGEAVSQVLWSVVALLFPVGILLLIQGSIFSVTQNTSGVYELFERAIESVFLRVISPLANLFNVDTFNMFTDNTVWENFMTVAMISALSFIVLSFGLGLWMFNRAPQENNGRFFMFTNWLWLVHVIMVVCFAMLGGIILANLSYPTNSILYVVGFVIGGFLAHLLAKRLLYRLNLKLKS
ncbi:ABC transporter permease subunit [Exiguobacterium aurantiacum]|uniref:ABC-2 transporter permease n=1 Tax=Exiguobacterium aurantiacum TaxID=33987 RepID=A0ABY5FL36_9BACL|nr:ABC transporter permease subunit [Exiguobacterium aurantiacum]UTT42105.1 ABC-2 transporter permease [Exiguobacterium aurantiacum]